MRTTVIIILFLSPFVVFAQNAWWLTAGPSVNHQTRWMFSGSNLIQEGEFEVSPALGWQIQGGLDRRLGDGWALEIGLGVRKWHFNDTSVGPITFFAGRDSAGNVLADTVNSDINWRSGSGMVELQFAARRTLVDNANWTMSIGAQLGIGWILWRSSEMTNEDEVFAGINASNSQILPQDARGSVGGSSWSVRQTPHFSFGLTMVNDIPISDKLSFRVKPCFYYDYSIGETAGFGDRGWFNVINGRVDVGLVF